MLPFFPLLNFCIAVGIFCAVKLQSIGHLILNDYNATLVYSEATAAVKKYERVRIKNNSAPFLPPPFGL